MNTLIVIILILCGLASIGTLAAYWTTPRIEQDDQPRVPKNYPRECERIWDETEEFYHK